jgi:hypothetical protein
MQMPYKVLQNGSMNITQPGGAVHARQVNEGDFVLLVPKDAEVFLELGMVEPVNPEVDEKKVSRRKTKRRATPIRKKG